MIHYHCLYTTSTNLEGLYLAGPFTCLVIAGTNIIVSLTPDPAGEALSALCPTF